MRHIRKIRKKSLLSVRRCRTSRPLFVHKPLTAIRCDLVNALRVNIVSGKYDFAARLDQVVDFLASIRTESREEDS